MGFAVIWHVVNLFGLLFVFECVCCVFLLTLWGISGFVVWVYFWCFRLSLIWVVYAMLLVFTFCEVCWVCEFVCGFMFVLVCKIVVCWICYFRVWVLSVGFSFF